METYQNLIASTEKKKGDEPGMHGLMPKAVALQVKTLQLIRCGHIQSTLSARCDLGV